MNKKIIIELLISNYVLYSELLESDYNAWLDLKNIKIGDTVFEKTSLPLMVRAYANENYDLAFEYMNRSCGILLAINDNDGDPSYKIEKINGEIINWSNCEFIKLKKVKQY